MAHVSPTFVGSSNTNNQGASSANIIASVPAGVQEGDLLIAGVASLTAGITTPSGWTLLVTQIRTGSSVFNLYAKFAGPSESSTTFVSGAAHDGHAATVVAYRNAGMPTSDSVTSQAGTTATAPTCPANTSVFDNAVVGFFSNSITTDALPQSDTWGSPATERKDDAWGYTVGSTARMILSYADAPQASPGATPTPTVTHTSTTSGTQVQHSIVIPPVNRVPTYKDVSTAQITSAGTSLTVNYPAGSVSGDFLLMSVAAGNSTANTVAITTPAGWTLAGNLSNSGMEGSIYWRFRGAETSVVVSHGSAFSNAVMLAYTGAQVDPNIPINQIAGNYDAVSTATGVMPTITTTVDDCAIALFAHARRSSLTSGTTVSGWDTAVERTDTGDSGSLGTYFLKAAATDVSALASAYPADTITYSATTNRRFHAIVAIQAPQFATLIVDDTAAGTELAATWVLTGTRDDSAVATETATQRISGTNDTGTGTDAAAARAYTPTTGDTGAGTDNAAVRVFVPASDSGTATDTAIATNTPQSGDAGAGTDSASTRIRPTTESGAGTDAATLKATVVQNDSATATDNVTVIKVSQINDSGTGTDNAVIRHKPNDTGTGTDNGSVRAYRPASDTATGTDTSRIIIYASDSAAAVDNAFKSISGQLQASRLVVVQPESRVYTVDFENRITEVSREVRLVMVGEEL